MLKTRRDLTNKLNLLVTQLYESHVHYGGKFIIPPTELRSDDDISSWMMDVEEWIEEILRKAHKYRNVSVFLRFEGNTLHIKACANNWHGKPVETQENCRTISHLNLKDAANI